MKKCSKGTTNKFAYASIECCTVCMRAAFISLPCCFGIDHDAHIVNIHYTLTHDVLDCPHLPYVTVTRLLQNLC